MSSSKLLAVGVLLLVGAVLIGADIHAHMRKRLGRDRAFAGSAIPVAPAPEGGCTLPFTLPCTL